MFIQPDWWEVMQPGVGTNRYSYAFDDPVNGKDPGGNAAIYKDGHYVGQVNPRDPGYYEVTHEHEFGAPMPSDWATLNTMLHGGAHQSTATGQGAHIGFPPSVAPINPLQMDLTPTPSVSSNRYLSTLWANQNVKSVLKTLFYLSLADGMEHGVIFYNTIQEPQIGMLVQGTRDRTYLNSWGNTPLAFAHSHPYVVNGNYYNGPSAADRELSKMNNLPGFLVNWDGSLIGYGYSGDGIVYSDGGKF